MPVVMIMEWPGMTRQQYEELRRQVQWEHDAPKGAVLHVAALDLNGLRAVELWDSQEAFQEYFDTRLQPAAAKIGIAGVADYQVFPVHDLTNFSLQPGHTQHDPISSVPGAPSSRESWREEGHR